MVIVLILLLNDKRVISKKRSTVRASNPRASLTWTDNMRKLAMHSQQFVSWVYLYLIIAAAENTLNSMGNTFSTCIFFDSKTNRTSVCANGLHNFSVFQIECMFLF